MGRRVREDDGGVFFVSLANAGSILSKARARSEDASKRAQRQASFQQASRSSAASQNRTIFSALP